MEGRAGDVLDAFHQFDEFVLGAGSDRGETDAAVAHHHGGHAVPARRGDLLVPADLAIEVGVDVHEARGEQMALGVDGAGGGAG